MDKDIFKELKNFVVQTRWEYDFELRTSTRLESDLLITGDDAIDFLEAFPIKFNVDISTLDVKKYFNPEGDRILISIISFFIPSFRNGKKKTEITLGDLEKAIVLKKLDDAIMNH